MNFFKHLSLIIFCLCSSYLIAGTIYVDLAATGSNNGTSWANAYNSLEYAVRYSWTGDEIWVKKGTYYLEAPLVIPANSISIYGHFEGTETARSQRILTDSKDLTANRTIVNGASLSSNAMVQCMAKNSLSLADLTFTESNSAVIMLYRTNNAVLENLLVDDNSIVTHPSSSPDYILDVSSSAGLLVERCLFSNNYTNQSIVNFQNTVECMITNSNFIANQATYSGTVFTATDSYSWFVVNCGFSANNTSSNQTSGTCLSTNNCQSLGTNTVANCIFWGNGNATANTEIAGTSVEVHYSIVEGGYSGTTQSNVVDQDPQWTDAALNISGFSPALDGGSNAMYASASAVDIDGDERIYGSSIDMGAQELSTGYDRPFITTWNAQNTDGTESVTI